MSVAPTAHSLGIAPSGTPTFKIERAGADLNYHYQAFINTTLETYELLGDIESCWGLGDPTRHAVMSSEVYDVGMQAGGSVSNKQSFDNVKYKTSLWSGLTRTLSIACDLVNRVSMHCNTSSTQTDDYLM